MRGRGESASRGVAVALALCMALVFVHAKRHQAHRLDPVVSVVRDDALAPPQLLVLHVSRWWRIHITSLWQAPRLARENAALRAQVLNLQAQTKQLMVAQAENDSLRQQLGFEKRSPLPLLPAEVISLKPSPQMDTLTLNRGTANGVTLSQPVLSPNGGLVGQVVDVTPRSCTVLMLTDAGSSAGAEVLSSGVQIAPMEERIGICRGDHQSRLILTIPRIDADIKPGERVITSSLGAVYPKGLPIGTVQTVTTDRTLAVRQAILRPNADLNHLDEAFLVR